MLKIIQKPDMDVITETKRNLLTKTAVLLALFVFSVFLFPQTVKNLQYIAGTVRTFSSPGQLSLSFRRARTPQAGEQYLPQPVKSMLHLLRSNRVTAFRYSKAIEADEELRQRLIESAFPVLCTLNAPFLLSISGEQVPPGCRVVATDGGINLVHCP